MDLTDYAVIRKVTGKPRRIEHMISVDTEDDTHGRLRVACVYGSYLRRKHKGYIEVPVEKTFYNSDDLVEFLNSLKTPGQDRQPCSLVGFNLAYDVPYFLKAVKFDTVMYSGSKIIYGELLNGIPMFDIFNHCGGRSLDHWINELNLNAKGIYKTEWRPDMTMQELVSHCENDVKAHWEVAEFFRKTYLDMGISFKLTTSSAALDLFQRKFFPHKMWRRLKETFNKYERDAYYGGRTECFSRGFHNVKSYDINSAYVSVMADEYYPKPDTARMHDGDEDFKYYFRNRNKLMIVHCEVTAPKRRVMVLPYVKRDKDGEKEGKLLFPYGRFSGKWCSPELHAAIKYGYKITKVFSYITYGHKERYLQDYANYTWDNRHAADAAGNGGMKQVWKLMGNGLYGKFAQQNPLGGKYSEEPLMVTEGCTPIMSRDGFGRLWYRLTDTDKVDAKCTFPCVSAFITCYTRLKLLEYLKRHEKDVIYCDTDCIKIPFDGAQEESSRELGGVKFEEDLTGEYVFLKPKLYGCAPASFDDIPRSYPFLEPLKGKTFLQVDNDADNWRIKGVGKYDLGYFNLEELYFHADYRKPNRFKESVARGLVINEWTDQEKDLDLIDDKRHWLNKDSEPLYIDERKDI